MDLISGDASENLTAPFISNQEASCGNSRLLSIGLILLSAGAVFAALRLRLGKTEPEISVQAAAISASAWFTYMLAVLSCELVIARYVEVALCYLLVGGLGFSWVCAAKIGKCFVEEPNQPPLLKEIGTAIGSRCGEEILGAVPRPKLIAERTYWNLIQK